MANRLTLPALYGPPALVALAHLLTGWLNTGGAGGLGALTTALSLVLALLSFALSVVALGHSYVKTPSASRSSWGLNVLLVCILLGLAPIAPTVIALVTHVRGAGVRPAITDADGRPACVQRSSGGPAPRARSHDQPARHVLPRAVIVALAVPSSPRTAWLTCTESRAAPTRPCPFSARKASTASRDGARRD